MTLYETLNDLGRKAGAKYPCTTVVAWYRIATGLLDDQQIYTFHDAQGIGFMLRNTERMWAKGTPRSQRLVIMPQDDVDPAFRLRAQEAMGTADIVVLRDLGIVSDGYWVCAVPRTWLEDVTGESYERYDEPSKEDDPEEEAQEEPEEEAQEESEPEPAPEPEPEPVAVAKTEIAEPVAVIMPQPAPRKQSAPRQQPAASRDDIFVYLAKHCRRSYCYARRSRWSGRVETYIKDGDIYRAYIIGVFVLLALWSAISLSAAYYKMANVSVVAYSLVVIIGAWSAFMWWVSMRVDKAREMLSLNI